MNERTSLFLFANLGPEVSRIFSLMEKGEQAHACAAHERAEHILQELRERPDMKSRLPELDILSTVLKDVMQPKPILSVSAQELEAYFQPFMSRLLLQSL